LVSSLLTDTRKTRRLDARRFTFEYSNDKSKVVLKGDMGKNSGQSVLPTELFQQYDPSELWTFVEDDYEYRYGVTVTGPSWKQLSHNRIEYSFDDMVEGRQTRVYEFSRDVGTGSIVTREIE
jgi:hypothetical protein